MSEYWKSTPKIWCKHCKTYVRDTKLEKANHDATPKHQGNLKRFLRDLHRDHEKGEKDKERAKSEVARLNGLVSNSSSNNGEGSSSAFGRGPTPSISRNTQATPAQRKQQLAQLAEMGVAIPDEFKPDMAMAGEWTVTKETVLEANGERKTEAVALGVRKREVNDEEQEEAEIKKKRWGSKFKGHPVEEEEGDLDALLDQAMAKPPKPLEVVAPKFEMKMDSKSNIKVESPPGITAKEIEKEIPEAEGKVKQEFPDALADIPAMGSSEELPKKEDEDEVSTGVIFKKRKAKNIRQK